MNLLEIDSNSVEYVEMWVKNAWPTLAAAAHGHFLDRGRGALVVNLRDAEPTADFITGRRAALGYLTAEMIAEMGEKLAELFQMVNGYDPATQAVLFIARAEGPPLSLCVSGGIAPIRASEQFQAAARAVAFLGSPNFG